MLRHLRARRASAWSSPRSRRPIRRCTSTTSSAARKELESRGVEFLGDALDTGVCHMAFFADPDGNALMLHGRYAPRES